MNRALAKLLLTYAPLQRSLDTSPIDIEEVRTCSFIGLIIGLIYRTAIFKRYLMNEENLLASVTAQRNHKITAPSPLPPSRESYCEKFRTSETTTVHYIIPGSVYSCRGRGERVAVRGQVPKLEGRRFIICPRVENPTYYFCWKLYFSLS